MTPLYQKGFFDYPTGMAIAVVLGIGFGFVLERGGFGRAKVMVSDFYGDDLRVTKVMFTAVVTTATGLGVLGGIGFVDLTALVIPETFIGAHIVGGVLLGIGFVMSGYCPGTALVSVASGYKDGLMALVGIMVGSLLFAAVYDPWLADFYVAGNLGVLTLPDVLGVPWAVVAVGVAVVAIATFFGSEKLEEVVCRYRGVEAPDDSPVVRRRVFVGLSAVAALGLVTLGLPAAASPPADSGHHHVSGRIGAVDLAQELSSGHDRLWLVDLRDSDTCQEERIRGAMCLSDEDPDAAFIAALAPTRTLVLYADGTPNEVPVSVASYGHGVRLLVGGFDAFERQILTEPRPPREATREAVGRYERRAALHGYFTGSEAPPPPVVARPTTVVRQRARRGGGC